MKKIGIIGFGKMGMLHGALLNGSGQYEIGAICDKSMVMRVGFKKIYGNVHCYCTADKMFAHEKLDVVVVTTPTFNHMESVLLALQYGCAVFVEKPLTITAEQAKMIADEATRRNLPVQVGFCNRFALPILKGREMIRQKIIGDISSVTGEMYIADVFEAHSGWRYAKAMSGGGVLMDFGIHLIDLLIWYFGKVDSVSAKSKKIYSLEVEDELEGEISFSNGIKSYISTSWSKKDYRKSYTKIMINGSKGILEITDQTLRRLNKKYVEIESYTYPDMYSGYFLDIGGALYSKQMQVFLNYIDTMKTEGCTPEEAVYVQRVIESLYKSSETGRIIYLGDI